MNLLAGILIGAFAPSWILKVVSPFVWALVFVAYKWIQTKIKFNPKIIFVEYTTAVITSLILSLLVGSIIQLVHSFL